MEVGDNLTNERGWQLSTRQLKAVLGYKEWPADGFNARQVGNVRVYCFAENKQVRPGRRKHRAYAICPVCEKHVPAGRLHQHLKVHKGV